VPGVTEVTLGRLAFKIGEAFSADNPIAAFLGSLSTALNGPLLTHRRLVGGDDLEPGLHDLGAAAHQFLLPMSISDVREPPRVDPTRPQGRGRRLFVGTFARRRRHREDSLASARHVGGGPFSRTNAA
jgi:hypothetical protein